MVDRKVMAFALAAVFVVGIFGPNIATMIQTAEGHGVQAQLQSRFIRIEDETFNRQSLQTGEVLTLSGAFVSLIDSDMRAWSSIFSESTDYEISARALEPGVYHVHTQLNIEHVGPGLGPGQTVVVEGEPILKPIPYTNIAYQSIIIAVGYVITFATRPWQVI